MTIDAIVSAFLFWTGIITGKALSDEWQRKAASAFESVVSALGVLFFCVLFWWWVGAILTSDIPAMLREAGWL